MEAKGKRWTKTQPGMSAQTRTLPDSSVQPSFLPSFFQPAEVGQDPSVVSMMRAFEGRKKIMACLCFMASYGERGGLILMICIREEEFWFL